MAGQLTIDTLKASSGVLATQNGMTGIARAWVQFAGASGTIAGSFNVSSVTRNSTGYYTLNFSTAMPNINYSLIATTGINSSATSFLMASAFGNPNNPYYTAPTTTSCTLETMLPAGTLADGQYVNAAIFGS